MGAIRLDKCSSLSSNTLMYEGHANLQVGVPPSQRLFLQSRLNPLLLMQ